MKKTASVFIVLALVAPAIVAAQSATTQDQISQQQQQQQQQRNLQTLMAKVKSQLSQEITRRIAAMRSFEASLKNSMLTAGADMKSSLGAISTQIGAHITTLQILQAQIEKETDVTKLRNSVASMNSLYQTYELAVIKASIIIGASNINAIADQMSALAEKLTVNVSALSQAGFSFPDKSIKTALEEAKSRSINAMNNVQALQPANGDQATQASNIAVISGAIKTIQGAQLDIQVSQRNIKDTINKIITATPSQPGTSN